MLPSGYPLGYIPILGWCLGSALDGWVSAAWRTSLDEKARWDVHSAAVHPQLVPHHRGDARSVANEHYPDVLHRGQEKGLEFHWAVLLLDLADVAWSWSAKVWRHSFPARWGTMYSTEVTSTMMRMLWLAMLSSTIITSRWEYVLYFSWWDLIQVFPG